MKNILPLSFAIFIASFPTHLKAQDAPWLEVGSEWIYQHGSYGTSSQFQVKYGITEMTSFAGQTCAKMEELDFGSGNLSCISIDGPYYFFVSNDSLYYACEVDSTFRLVADFGASIGDSWEYLVVADYGNSSAIDTFMVTVTGVSTLNVEDYELRQLELDYEWLGSSTGEDFILGLYFGYPAQLTEVIGGNGFFAPFGHFGFCDADFNAQIQCFESPSFSYLNPEYPSCTYVVGLDENALEAALNIFPNPARGIVQLEIPETWHGQSGNVQLHNSKGQLVYEQSSVLSSLEYIPIQELPRGMYLLSIQAEEERGISKLVLE